MKDYYSLLGVDRKATEAEIKKNYRYLAKEFHPDKNSDPKAGEKFIAINEAYEVLSNKKTRVRYDLYRWEQQKRQQPSSTVVRRPFESTRSRRKKSQRKRSEEYHQEKEGFFKSMQLVQESLIITSRYLLHIFGITLFSVIMISIVSQLSGAFDIAVFRGVILSAFVLLLVFVIFKLFIHIITAYKKDLLEFSFFYKITQQKVALVSVVTIGFIFILYVMLFFRLFVV